MLNVKRFIFNPFGENTYIVWSDDNTAAIIDPGMMNDYENSVISYFITTNNLRPVKLLNTHAHIDHIAGNNFISNKYGITAEINIDDYYLADHINDQAKMFGIPYASKEILAKQNLSDNETIEIGNDKLSAIHIPGHTKGHLAFYSAKSGILFSGDAIFRMSIGRTDLPGGDYTTLINSIDKRIMMLPDNITIYPGHGDTTTIGFERANSPYLT